MQRPEAILRDWDFKEILRLRMPALVRACGIDAIRFLCDLLDVAVGTYRGTGDDVEATTEIREDFSRIWRPDIGTPDFRGNEGVLDALVNGLRDAALQILEAHFDLIDDVLSELEGRRWAVFWRINLHVLRKAGPQGSSLACAYLTNPILANEFDVENEYLELLGASFGTMTGDCQRQVLELIDAGPDINNLREEVDQEWFIRQWRWHMLAAIKDELPGEKVQEWHNLSSEFGTDLAIPRGGIVRWSGRTEAIGVERLNEMSIIEIAEFLNKFDPGDGFGRATEDDLSRELAESVSTDPGRFINGISNFDDVSIVYKAGLIGGFKSAAEGGSEFEWSPVLLLCQQVLSDARALTSSESYSARREACGLLLSALAPKGTEIPIEFRSDVWNILAVLVEDSDPSEEVEKDTTRGWYELAINTIRGRAVEAMIMYAVWLRRHTSPETIADDASILQEEPDLKTTLERHLDISTEPSQAVRSVYGVFLPVLHFLAKDWVADNLEKLFPTANDLTQHRQAVWDGYVHYARLDLSLLDLMRDEYARSIELIGSTEVVGTGKSDERIGMHLGDFYWHGRLDLNDPLLLRYFMAASDEVRGQVLASIGQDLRREHEPLPADVIARLKALWDWRIDVAKTGSEGEYLDEMAAFGWTFASGELGDSWRLMQLESALKIAGRVSLDHEVVETLASLGESYPAETVRCLRLMIDGIQEQWQIHHWASNMELVFGAALRSGHDEAIQNATTLINRLAARGHLQFARLLEEGDPNQS